MEKKVFTQQEIWDASKHLIQKNKKKYNRKTKHKNNGKEKGGSPEE